MAKIKIVGTGSSGNCYLLETSNGTLVIEAGVSWKEVKKALNYDTSKIVGCIASHQHLDHSAFIYNMLQAGIDVYAPCMEHFLRLGCKPLAAKVKKIIGDFEVLPLAVKHGDTVCFSYVINHEEIGNLLFATDLESFPYKVKNLNHIFIEANYSEEVIVDEMMDNHFTRSHYKQHMSIEKCVEAVKLNYSADLQEVVLIHMSSTNSDETQFVKAVKDAIGLDNVYAAKPDMELELTKEEF